MQWTLCGAMASYLNSHDAAHPWRQYHGKSRTGQPQLQPPLSLRALGSTQTTAHLSLLRSWVAVRATRTGTLASRINSTLEAWIPEPTRRRVTYRPPPNRGDRHNLTRWMLWQAPAPSIAWEWDHVHEQAVRTIRQSVNPPASVRWRPVGTFNGSTGLEMVRKVSVKIRKVELVLR